MPEILTFEKFYRVTIVSNLVLVIDLGVIRIFFKYLPYSSSDRSDKDSWKLKMTTRDQMAPSYSCEDN